LKEKKLIEPDEDSLEESLELDDSESEDEELEVEEEFWWGKFTAEVGGAEVATVWGGRGFLAAMAVGITEKIISD